MSNKEIALTSETAILFLQKSEISTNEKEKLIRFLNQQTSFKLAWNSIGESGVKIIAEVLKVNNTLTYVQIAGNGIGDSGTQAIADALKVNNTLTHLDLNGYIGNLEAQAIADALKVNNTLTRLNLKSNDINNEGARAIAGVLKIDKFAVKETKLTNTNIENIEQALKIKKVLLYLDLSHNKIENEGLNAIAEMLKVNNSLRTLRILANYFTDSSKIGDALKYNRSLTELIINEEQSTIKELEKALPFNICLLKINRAFDSPFESSKIKELLYRNEKIQTNLSKRIFECKNAYLSLLDYKILERVNVAVIFNNIWKLHQTQQTEKTYEECLREYWELISLNTFSKYFLFILGICKLNQIPQFKSHLLGIPKEILNHIGSFLNPKDFSIVKK